MERFLITIDAILPEVLTLFFSQRMRENYEYNSLITAFPVTTLKFGAANHKSVNHGAEN